MLVIGGIIALVFSILLINDLESELSSDSESENETEITIENQQNQETENLPEIPIPEAYTEHVDVNLEELIASLH